MTRRRPVRRAWSAVGVLLALALALARGGVAAGAQPPPPIGARTSLAYQDTAGVSGSSGSGLQAGCRPPAHPAQRLRAPRSNTACAALQSSGSHAYSISPAFDSICSPCPAPFRTHGAAR